MLIKFNDSKQGLMKGNAVMGSFTGLGGRVFFNYFKTRYRRKNIVAR